MKRIIRVVAICALVVAMGLTFASYSSLEHGLKLISSDFSGHIVTPSFFYFTCSTKICPVKYNLFTQHHRLPPEFAEIEPILTQRAKPSDLWRAAFFKLIRYRYGSGCTSYGCQSFDIRKAFHVIWQASRRLADTMVENKDFEALIRQYDRDDAFFLL